MKKLLLITLLCGAVAPMVASHLASYDQYEQEDTYIKEQQDRLYNLLLKIGEEENSDDNFKAYTADDDTFKACTADEKKKFKENIRTSRIEQIRETLIKGADADHVYEDGFTVLNNAISLTNDPEVIKELMFWSADKNAANRDSEGLTPLMLAAKLGKIDMLKQLIEYGADATLVDKKGKTAKDWARTNEIAKLIDDAAKEAEKNLAIDARMLKTSVEYLKQMRADNKKKSRLRTLAGQKKRVARIKEEAAEKK